LEFPSVTVLSVFIPTFFMVSITPGMCMTLALTLGMRFGMRAVAWMMIGELTGVGLVAALSALGVAAILLAYPMLFNVLKIGGGLYLMYLGMQMWQAKGKMALTNENALHTSFSPKALISQGFITAIANPKGWAFFIALLPPFLDMDKSIASQLSVLLFLILTLEALCLVIYGAGGKSLGRFLGDAKHQKTLNRSSGGLLAIVGIWLMLS
jgi:homoserine/homoserine lactone efflux protein